MCQKVLEKFITALSVSLAPSIISSRICHQKAQLVKNCIFIKPNFSLVSPIISNTCFNRYIYFLTSLFFMCRHSAALLRWPKTPHLVCFLCTYVLLCACLPVHVHLVFGASMIQSSYMFFVHMFLFVNLGFSQH